MTANESQQIGALTADVANLKKQLETQQEMLKEVRDAIVMSKGSWRVLITIGSLLMAVSSVLTGLIIKFWPGN